MALARSDGPGTVSGMNITPLVDVMLVLLVIFMVAAPIATGTIGLDLPGAGPGTRSAPAEPIRLRIDPAGQLTVNGLSAQVSALPVLLQAEIARAPDAAPMLRIEASDAADYGVVAKVLAAARNANIERVVFAPSDG